MDLIDVAAETQSGRFGDIELVCELEQRSVKRGGRNGGSVTRTSTLHARWGPMTTMEAWRKGERLGDVEFNVWVHVSVVYSDGFGSHVWRPRMQVNVSAHFDWMGRFRCDLFFQACGDPKIWLHRVAALCWGNNGNDGQPPPLSYAQFQQRVAGAVPQRYVYEADHTNGDCMCVRFDKCEVVTRSENERRELMRRDLQLKYLEQYARVQFDTMIRKLTTNKERQQMRTLRSLFEKYLKK